MMSLSDFGIRVILASENKLEVFPPLLYFGRVCEGLIYFFNAL